MRLWFRPLFAAAAAVLSAAVGAAAGGPSLPATPPDYVVDLAGVIDDGQERALSATLRELERATTAQVLVLTVPSLEGEALEAFSVDVAHNRWRLGQPGKDNGVLITLALQERRYRIEVGYGLEGVLPDSLVGSIGRQLLVPAFRAGDYGGGLAAAAGEISARIATASGVELPGVAAPAVEPAAPRGGTRGRPGPLATALALLALAGFFWLLVRHPRVLVFLLLSSRGAGSRGSWGGGGGFGGFGGGGGGGFGGGGASGSW